MIDMPIPPVRGSGPVAWPKTGRFPAASRHPPVPASEPDTWDACRCLDLGSAGGSQDPHLQYSGAPLHSGTGCLTASLLQPRFQVVGAGGLVELRM